MNHETTFLNDLLEKSIKAVEANKERGLWDGIQRLLTNLYPDTAHFIFELLQNAEDAKASRIVFDLKKEKLTVTHDGKRLFNKMDVESITNIGESTKRDDINQIGKFGIGFKAVFSYTSTPRVYSGNFSFEIRDMICPHSIENRLKNKNETLFEFPFNHLKKHKAEAFKETARGLENLRENVLLFLNNIETIEWNIEGKGKGYIKRLSHGNKHFEVEHKNITGKTAKSHWLRFTKQIDPNSKIKNVAVAFKLESHEGIKGKKKNIFDNKVSISKQLQIIPIDGQLSVFFPAEKETTKLKFHIHGPFAATVARDSIPHNNDNKRLIRDIELLLAESLHKIRDMGLLTVDFLAVLPNDGDDLTDFYKPLQAAVIKEMKANPLVPTLMKGHAPATQLNQGPAAIREVISNADLQFLLKKKSIIQWAAGAMQNSQQECFMRLLGINDWSWENLVDAVKDKFSWGNDRAKQWLTTKSDEWMQKLYILLKKAMDETHSSMSYCHIVRLQSGEHVSGDDAFFPSEENKKSKKNDIFPRVKSDLLRGKRKQRVRQFLEAIGVKEVGKQEELKCILDTYYSKDDDSENDIELSQHILHMKRFVSFWRNQKEEAVEMFSEHAIFCDNSGETLKTADDLYLDKPYSKTMLEDYFRKAQKGGGGKHKLWTGYKKAKITKLLDFAIAMGVLNELKIDERNVPRNHPDKKELHKDYYAKWTSNRIDEDYTIDGIETVLKRPDTSASYLIWQCITNADPKTQQACFCPNASYPTREAPSSLVYTLKKYAWIPAKNGKFYKPNEMTKEMLHRKIRYDNRNNWLTAIGFGENERKKTEEHKALREGCKKIGLSEEWVGLFDEIAKLPKGEQKEKMKQFKNQLYESRLKTSFPEKESHNPERRAIKIAEKLADASKKSYSIKDRSVRTSNREVRPDVGFDEIRNNW